MRASPRFTLFDGLPGGATGAVEGGYDGRAEISVRGNSSYAFHKKSYRLELQDEHGKDRGAPLLGLPADSDWVLYASVTDHTFVRNVLGPEVWRRMGRYASRWRLVELFVVASQTPELAVSPEGLGAEAKGMLDDETASPAVPRYPQPTR